MFRWQSSHRWLVSRECHNLSLIVLAHKFRRTPYNPHLWDIVAAFLKPAPQLAVGCIDGTVHIHTLCGGPDGQPNVVELPAPILPYNWLPDPVTALAFSPNGVSLAVGRLRGISGLDIYDLRRPDLRPRVLLPCHPPRVLPAITVCEGLSSRQPPVLTWVDYFDSETDNHVDVLAICFSPISPLVALGHRSGLLVLADSDTGVILRHVWNTFNEFYCSPIETILFDSSGTLVFFGGGGQGSVLPGVMRCMNIHSGVFVFSQWFETCVLAMSLADDWVGLPRVFVSTEAGEIHVLNGSDGILVHSLSSLFHGVDVSVIWTSPEGRYYAAFAEDYEICSISSDPLHSNLEKTFPYVVDALCYSTNARVLAAGCSDGSLWLHSAGAEIRRVFTHTSAVQELSFSS